MAGIVIQEALADIPVDLVVILVDILATQTIVILHLVILVVTGIPLVEIDILLVVTVILLVESDILPVVTVILREESDIPLVESDTLCLCPEETDSPVAIQVVIECPRMA